MLQLSDVVFPEETGSKTELVLHVFTVFLYLKDVSESFSVAGTLAFEIRLLQLQNNFKCEKPLSTK